MTKTAENSEKKILLRLPAKVANEVAKRAKQRQRSVNGQIVFELTSSTLSKNEMTTYTERIK